MAARCGPRWRALRSGPRDLLEALHADSGLVPTVVEEFLRLDGPARTATERFATEDMRVGDVSVRRGDMLLVSLAAANRDPARFEAPDEFRSSPRAS